MYGMGFIINSYLFVPSGSYLVDTYSPIVAFDLRKISSTATNCLRVRRDSDNAEQDIGFSGNDLDTSALSSFVGAGSGYVAKWYNQGTGGATYDASQTNTAYQQRIVDTGTIYTNGGKTAIETLGRRGLTIAGDLLSIKTVFAICNVNTSGAVPYFYGGTTKGFFYGGTFSGINGLGGFDGSNIRSITGEDNNRHLGYFNIRGGNLYVSKDGNSETNTGTFGNMNLRSISGYLTDTMGSGTYSQSFLIFDTDESANKTAIETELNSYYSVY